MEAYSGLMTSPQDLCFGIILPNSSKFPTLDSPTPYFPLPPPLDMFWVFLGYFDTTFINKYVPKANMSFLRSNFPFHEVLLFVSAVPTMKIWLGTSFGGISHPTLLNIGSILKPKSF